MGSGGTTRRGSTARRGVSSKVPVDTRIVRQVVGAHHFEVALSGVIPALVAMWLVDRLDAKRPEPARTRRLVVLAGMLSVIPALVIEVGLSSLVGARLEPQLTYQGASFQAFVVAAAVEEACKIAVVYWVVWRRPEFDERMDGIVYASRAGLGFALVENVMYLLGQHSLSGQLVVWVERALLAVPGHAMWTGMIGAVAARRRFDRRGFGLRQPAFGSQEWFSEGLGVARRREV